MEEKRRFFRLNFNTNVKWSKIPSTLGSDIQKEDVTRNISEGGICLIVYEKVQVADMLNLEIELPGPKIIYAIGRIAWLKEFEIISTHKNNERYDIGVEFIDIRSEDREDIKRFVFTPFSPAAE